MADARQMKQANTVYGTLCDALNAREWHYEEDKEKLTIRLNVSGDDISMRLIFIVDADRQLLRLLSFLPFKVKEDKRTELAVALCETNYAMADGGFDMDLSDGSILFRMNASYRDSIIGEDLVQYVISCACHTIDKYNDRFFMLAKGMITIEQFVEMEGA